MEPAIRLDLSFTKESPHIQQRSEGITTMADATYLQSQTPMTHQNEGKKKSKKKWIIGGVIGVFVLGGIGAALSDDEEEDQEPTAEEAPEEDTEAEEEEEDEEDESEEQLEVIGEEENDEENLEEAVEREEEDLAEEVEDEASEMTSGEANALSHAESYLNYTGFSREGLIGQLEFEDYTTAEAEFAVDNVEVDWNEQAVRVAESYLDYTSFSRQGLIDQLLFEGFTQEQAEHGVNEAY
ncbi:Ltp family lipoprotein [Nesterenkonia ebinurensis]|uniref:Ltp family lipoprotein n=1 Tax=Nesterenkonia ebinurensis TaxID=2608252 RepID=UPI001CC6400B|nr:Ltp family lipoprotein [Nesterenkonia ebinurensis]